MTVTKVQMMETETEVERDGMKGVIVEKFMLPCTRTMTSSL